MGEDPARTAAIRNGDPVALAAVARETMPGLLRAARAAGLTPAAAEDAVQEALMVFVKRSADFDGRARVAAWIHGILVRKIQEQRRILRRDLEHDPIDEVVERRFRGDGRWSRPPTGPEGDVLLAEVRTRIAGCLEGLPDRQRLAFTLREVEGLTTEETCKILDVTANNLGVLLFRARNRLRECLEAHTIMGSDDARVS
ncbi:MAG: sigma-70 family RNA polymerase sigma factor [Gemmatimonadales bacterium]